MSSSLPVRLPPSYAPPSYESTVQSPTRTGGPSLTSSTRNNRGTDACPYSGEPPHKQRQSDNYSGPRYFEPSSSRETNPLINRTYQMILKEEDEPRVSRFVAFLLVVAGWALFGVAAYILFQNGVWRLNGDNSRPNLTDEEREQQERLRYRNGGMVWGVPNAYKHCTAYNNRTYTARLYNIPKGYDLKKSCKYTPITIYDQTFEEPAMCFTEDSWNTIYGLWHVEDIRCRPHWGSPSDRGCTGLGSGSRRVESRLWSLRKGEDWFALCESTPITLFNKYIERPTYCESRGLFKGFWGIWDLEDETCTSFAPADFEEFETVNSNAGEAEPSVLPEDS